MATIDVDKLTLGQIEQMEDVAGVTVDQWARRKVKFAIAALIVLGGHAPDDVRAMTREQMQKALDALES